MGIRFLLSLLLHVHHQFHGCVLTYANAGVADSLSAGSLIYLSLVEMVGPYFAAPEVADRSDLKLAMLAAFTAGAALMAILAIWA